MRVKIMNLESYFLGIRLVIVQFKYTDDLLKY